MQLTPLTSSLPSLFSPAKENTFSDQSLLPCQDGINSQTPPLKAKPNKNLPLPDPQYVFQLAATDTHPTEQTKLIQKADSID